MGLWLFLLGLVLIDILALSRLNLIYFYFPSFFFLPVFLFTSISPSVLPPVSYSSKLLSSLKLILIKLLSLPISVLYLIFPTFSFLVNTELHFSCKLLCVSCTFLNGLNLTQFLLSLLKGLCTLISKELLCIYFYLNCWKDYFCS